jgi:hypothetical protein
MAGVKHRIAAEPARGRQRDGVRSQVRRTALPAKIGPVDRLQRDFPTKPIVVRGLMHGVISGVMSALCLMENQVVRLPDR